MNKKAISLFLSVVLLFSLAVPVTFASENIVYDELMSTTAVVDFMGVYQTADTAALNTLTNTEIKNLITHLDGMDHSLAGIAHNYNALVTSLLALPNAPAKCAQCGALDSHAVGCSLAEPVTTPEPTATPDVTPEPTVTPDPAADPDVTPEPETTPEPMPTVFEQIMAGATTTEMLITMNGLIESHLDAVFALTFEEIDAIAQQAKSLDPELASQDTIDLLDTLTYLPNSMAKIGCPDCGQMVEHAEDCPRVNGAMMPADGAISGQTISKNTTWELTRDCTLSGTITINNGVTLTISSKPGNKYTIKRNFNSGDMFVVNRGGTLIIDNVIISGEGRTATGSAIYVACPQNTTNVSKISTLRLTGVTIVNCKMTSDYGAALKFGENNGYNNTVDAEINNCIIDNCDAPQGSAIMLHQYCHGTIKLNNTTIKNCDATGSWGGTIRTQGKTDVQLKIHSCTIENNYSVKNGGGVYWNASGDNALLSITGTADAPTIIRNNSAGTQGGGVHLGGQSIIIEHTQIYGNSAPNGGGISMTPYDNDGDNVLPSAQGCDLTLGEGALISGNTATTYGGGIYMGIESADAATGTDFSITVNDGAVIQGNSAQYGGAFAILQELDSASDNHTYDVKVTVAGGVIGGTTAEQANKATADGGAFYISRAYKDYGSSRELNFNITGGSILGNTAGGNGGALYLVDEGNNAQVTLTGGTVSGNTAGTNGGGICVSSGNLNMTGGAVNGNTASGNGGGINVDSGNVTVYGGTVDGNTAGVYGGGINVSKGDILIESGSVSGNSATNGGALTVISNGEVTIGWDKCKTCTGVVPPGDQDHTCPVMDGNKAKDNGGAIGIVAGVTKMYCGSMNGNLCENNPASNTYFQSGGSFDIYGGNLNIGVDIQGGTYTDHRPGVHKVTFVSYYNDTEYARVTQEVSSGQLTLPGSAALSSLFEREGMVLYGWSLTPGQMTDQYLVGATIPFPGDATLYAIWVEQTYTITYNTGAGSIPAGAPTSYTFSPTESNVTVPVAGNNTDGATFLGWNITGEGNWGTGSCTTNLVTTGKYGNVTLTANWGEVAYNITYDLDGGVDPGNPVGFNTGDLEQGLALKDPTKDGYTFTGWYDTDKNKTYEPNHTIVKKDGYRDYNLRALWSLNPYEVVVNYNGGTDGTGNSGTTIPYTIVSGLNLPVVSRLGYTFSGWSAAAADSKGNNWNLNQLYTDSNITGVYGNVTLTAQWTEDMVTINYVVSSFGGGVISLAEETVGASKDPVGSVATPAPGYKFVGWYDANGNEVSKNAAFVPAKVGGLNVATTYTAKFDYDLTGLTIEVSGSSDANQAFLFEVSGNVMGSTFTTTVSVCGNSSVTIDGLQIGNSYTVKPLNVWSWRYGDQAAVNHTLQVPTGDNKLEFEVAQNNPYWLSGDHNAVVNGEGGHDA